MQTGRYADWQMDRHMLEDTGQHTLHGTQPPKFEMMSDRLLDGWLAGDADR